MNRFRYAVDSLALLSLLSVFFLVSCGPVDNPTGVPAGDANLPSVVVSTNCPPVGDTCMEVFAAMEEACPRGTRYRNYGELNSCERRLFGQSLEVYEGCYTDSELREIRNCVIQLRSETGDHSKRGPFENS